MITEVWPWHPIGDLFEFQAGKTMSAQARDGLERTPFLRTSNVFWDEIDLSKVDEMAMTPRDLEDKALRAGDLLVCEGGDIGRSAVWGGQVATMSFQNHLHRLRPVSDDIDPDFYVYFLQSAFTQLGIFEGAGNKTTIPNLSRNRLAALEVPKPPFAEQHGIKSALKRVRLAIKTNDTAIQVAQELKCAVMGEVFTRGLRGEAQKDSEIGPVPNSWAVAKLGEVSALSTGGTPPTKNRTYYEGENPFIKTADVLNNRISQSNLFISDQALKDCSLSVLPKGTVIMAMYGQGKTRGQVSILEINATITQNAAAISVHETMNATFVWQYLRSSYEKLRGMGSLGHISHLNLGYLREFSIVRPPLDEQCEIVEILDAIDAKIDLHKSKKAVLEELFRALLHKLMTGTIRVADLDLSALDGEVTG